VAFGLLLELETQLIVAQRLRLGDATALEPLFEQTSEVSRLLNGLRRSLEIQTDRAEVDPEA
jgi:hypothetical protein